MSDEGIPPETVSSGYENIPDRLAWELAARVAESGDLFGVVLEEWIEEEEKKQAKVDPISPIENEW